MRRLTVLLAALAASGVAYGAFTVYDSTVSGVSRTNSFDASSAHQSKLIVSQTGDASGWLSPGGTITIPVSVSNPAHTGAVDETVTGLAGSTFQTTPDSSCGSHLTVTDPSGSVVGQGVSPGHKIDGTLSVSADGGLPASCAGGTYVVQFGGTVAP